MALAQSEEVPTGAIRLEIDMKVWLGDRYTHTKPIVVTHSKTEARLEVFQDGEERVRVTVVPELLKNGLVKLSLKTHTKLGSKEREREMTLITRLASPGSFAVNDTGQAERFEIEVLPSVQVNPKASK